MTLFRSCVVFLVSFLFAAACVGGDPGEGEERGPCHEDGTCDEDYLVCNEDNICVVPERGERGAPCREEMGEDPCDPGLTCGTTNFCLGPGDCDGPDCAGPECGPGFHPEGSDCVPNDGGEGIVMGKIVDAKSQSGVGGAKIALAGRTVSTNEQGFFSVANVPAEIDSVLDIRAEGYAKNKRTVTARTGVSTHLDVTLLPHTAQSRIVVDSGGTVSGDGAKADFGSGVLDASGSVTVSLSVLDPDNDADLPAFPGDFLTSDKEKLEGFGAMALQLVDDSGDEIETGSETDINVEIPVTGAAPDEIALWRLDERSARWMRQGTLSGCGDGVCEGTITGGGWWSMAEVMESTCVELCVNTISGDPAVGVSVQVKGVDHKSMSYGYTESNGCACMDVKRNAEVEVSASFSGGVAGPESVSTPGNAASCGSPDCERLDVSLTISPPVFQASLTWGASPEDLDAHLTGPCDPVDGYCEERFHVYFGDGGSMDSAPWAYLDTDDTTSFGPEITSISRCVPGIYRYSVNNYSGSPGFDGSEAKVFIIFPDGSVQDINVPGGAGSDDMVWVVGELDCSSSSSGNRGDCDCSWHPLNQFLPDMEQSYHPGSGSGGTSTDGAPPPSMDGGVPFPPDPAGTCEPMSLPVLPTGPIGDTCTVVLPGPVMDILDPSLMVIFVDGAPLNWDPDCYDYSGWYLQGSDTVVFCPAACDTAASAEEITVEVGCPTAD